MVHQERWGAGCPWFVHSKYWQTVVYPTFNILIHFCLVLFLWSSHKLNFWTKDVFFGMGDDIDLLVPGGGDQNLIILCLQSEVALQLSLTRTSISRIRSRRHIPDMVTLTPWMTSNSEVMNTLVVLTKYYSLFSTLSHSSPFILVPLVVPVEIMRYLWPREPIMFIHNALSWSRETEEQKLSKKTKKISIEILPDPGLTSPGVCLLPCTIQSVGVSYFQRL